MSLRHNNNAKIIIFYWIKKNYKFVKVFVYASYVYLLLYLLKHMCILLNYHKLLYHKVSSIFQRLLAFSFISISSNFVSTIVEVTVLSFHFLFSCLLYLSDSWKTMFFVVLTWNYLYCVVFISFLFKCKGKFLYKYDSLQRCH